MPLQPEREKIYEDASDDEVGTCARQVLRDLGEQQPDGFVGAIVRKFFSKGAFMARFFFMAYFANFLVRRPLQL
jgi:hypothetical protein